MSRNPRTPLSPIAEEALGILETPIDNYGDDGCPREEAHELLADQKDFSNEQAEVAIHQLLMRGYLYEVDDHLFVTP